MKKVLLPITFLFVFFASFAITDKKVKTLDHYYLNLYNEVCSSDDAAVEVKVISEEDSIKVYSWSFDGNPLSVETYRILNDSVQDKWGTQVSFWPNGAIPHIHQFIDKLREIDHVKVYNIKGILEKETYVDRIKGFRSTGTWYEDGKVKSYTATSTTSDNKLISETKTWFETGEIKTIQKQVNGVSETYTIYEKDGSVAFKLPLSDGDKIYLNQDGNACTKNVSAYTSEVHIENDSIKIFAFNNKGKLHMVQNFMHYTPEQVIKWGTQHYYYTTLDNAQPVDSLILFKGINDETLKEIKYYPNGKLLSEKVITFNEVLIPIEELRQYGPEGTMRRYQKRKADVVVEGKMYDSEGKEIPFIEFKEQY